MVDAIIGVQVVINHEILSLNGCVHLVKKICKKAATKNKHQILVFIVLIKNLYQYVVVLHNQVLVN